MCTISFPLLPVSSLSDTASGPAAYGDVGPAGSAPPYVVAALASLFVSNCIPPCIQNRTRTARLYMTLLSRLPYIPR